MEKIRLEHEEIFRHEKEEREKRIRLDTIEREDRLMITFSYISLCKIFDPSGGAIFSPRSIIWRNLVEVYYGMLYTSYQGSRLSLFQTRRFLKV